MHVIKSPHKFTHYDDSVAVAARGGAAVAVAAVALGGVANALSGVAIALSGATVATAARGDDARTMARRVSRVRRVAALCKVYRK